MRQAYKHYFELIDGNLTGYIREEIWDKGYKIISAVNVREGHILFIVEKVG